MNKKISTHIQNKTVCTIFNFTLILFFANLISLTIESYNLVFFNQCSLQQLKNILK